MHTLLSFGAIVFYFLSAVSFISLAFIKKNFIAKTGFFIAVLGLFMQSFALIVRWIDCGFPPMTNLYESMFIFAWSIVFVFVVLVWKLDLKVSGVFIMPMAFLVMLYSFLLDDKITELMPALQSYWLSIHVITCFISYACFGCGFCLGVMYFIQERQLKKKHAGRLLNILPSLEVIDKTNYKLVLFGFIFLSIGIITGSIWASRAWGSWWSWDPKETWAFITWLIYAAYLHLRIISSCKPRQAALLSIIGFIAVLFTYLGVSYLIPGLHSYL